MTLADVSGGFGRITPTQQQVYGRNRPAAFGAGVITLAHTRKFARRARAYERTVFVEALLRIFEPTPPAAVAGVGAGAGAPMVMSDSSSESEGEPAPKAVRTKAVDALTCVASRRGAVSRRGMRLSDL